MSFPLTRKQRETNIPMWKLGSSSRCPSQPHARSSSGPGTTATLRLKGHDIEQSDECTLLSALGSQEKRRGWESFLVRGSLFHDRHDEDTADQMGSQRVSRWSRGTSLVESGANQNNLVSTERLADFLLVFCWTRCVVSAGDRDLQNRTRHLLRVLGLGFIMCWCRKERDVSLSFPCSRVSPLFPLSQCFSLSPLLLSPSRRRIPRSFTAVEHQASTASARAFFWSPAVS